MNKVFWFIIYLFVFLFSSGLVIGVKIWQPAPSPTPTFVPTPIIYTSSPPKAALQGLILETDGLAYKVPRDQFFPITATQGAQILEGDSILTSNQSHSSVVFGDIPIIFLDANTNLDLVSTNPSHFLVVQTDGLARYKTNDQIKNLSIRTFNGLVLIQNGEVVITTDAKNEEVEIILKSGTGTLGYVDVKNKTQIIALEVDNKLFFSSRKRTIKLR